MSLSKGSTSFYRLTEAIRDFLLTLDDVNTVTFGDITEVDLNKQTIFPLSHIMVNNVLLGNGTLTFSVTVLSMDIVHVDKNINAEDSRATDDTFYGVDNEQDVLNTQLAVTNLLNQSLSRASLRGNKFELTGQGSCEPFTDRFENKLAGWAYTFSAYVDNDINICE
tara:strand:+ start:24 stop:521 length:498 start_codon:yes stop_codon:yes gene_type:complete